MDSNNITKEQEILDSLRVKFVESSLEKLEEISVGIDKFRSHPHPDGLKTVLSEIHTLKGLGGTFGFRDFSLIAARLEYYLEGLSKISDQNFKDLKVFISRLHDCIERGAHSSVTDLDHILSELPTR